MSVAVKAPRIKFSVVGTRIPNWLIVELKKRYGENVVEISDHRQNDETVDISRTSWYRNLASVSTPGENMKLYRENRGLTQETLAERLGEGMRKQHISNMENGSRTISRETAKKLAMIFSCSVDRFI